MVDEDIVAARAIAARLPMVRISHLVRGTEETKRLRTLVICAPLVGMASDFEQINNGEALEDGIGTNVRESRRCQSPGSYGH